MAILRDLGTLVLVQSPTQAPATTTSSFNWWPYPPADGATATSSSTSSLDTAPVTTPTSSLSTATTSSTSETPSTTSYIEISALPPDAVAGPRPHTSIKTNFNPINLMPVFGAVGFLAGSLFMWACFHCNLRSRRCTGSDPLEPGPPYIAAENDWRGDEERSPSKHSMHGSAYSESKGLLARSTSHRTRNTGTTSPSSYPFSWPAPAVSGYEEDPFLVAPSTAAPTPARTATDFMSPDPLSLLGYDERDELATAPYDSLNHKSIRAGILDKLKLAATRKRAGEVRTRNGHARMNSDCQVVDGDGWGLGWTREKKNGIETYTALPSRAHAGLPVDSSSTGIRRVDSTILPTSPTVVSSARLHSELFFSPASSIAQTPEKRKRTRKTLRKEKTLPPLPPSLSTGPSSETMANLRPSSSYYLGSPPPKRSAAERHMARHSALNKVEEIISKSRSENGISLTQSPTSFGAIPEDAIGKQLKDTEGTGIEQRLFG